MSQIINSSGAPYIKVDKYHQYQNGQVKLSKHERFGNTIFNRNSRWCPPVDISYDEYKKCPSYPAPIGIRPKDFCLPSELVKVFEELMNQIMNFKNVKETTFEKVQKILPFIEKRNNYHSCRYCGVFIDINQCLFEKNVDGNTITYKSKENYIEICHGDPNGRFLNDNIYFGHGECNRRQGGFSETERMKDGIQLLFLNGKISIEMKQQLLSIL